MSSTRRPASTIAAPNDATVVVLATPPFWLATASTRVPFIRPLLLCLALAVNNCHPGTNSTVPARGWLCVSGRIGQHGRGEPPTGVVTPRGNRVVAVRPAHRLDRYRPDRQRSRAVRCRRSGT